MKDLITMLVVEDRIEKKTATAADFLYIERLATEKSYPRAEYILAKMYLAGVVGKKDRAKALFYLEQSSKHASYDLQMQIGLVYDRLFQPEKIKECLERAMDDLKNYL